MTQVRNCAECGEFPVWNGKCFECTPCRIRRETNFKYAQMAAKAEEWNNLQRHKGTVQVKELFTYKP